MNFFTVWLCAFGIPVGSQCMLRFETCIQDVPGGKVNILRSHSNGHSKQKYLYEHMSYFERFPR